jgi:hypothetical protein
MAKAIVHLSIASDKNSEAIGRAVLLGDQSLAQLLLVVGEEIDNAIENLD